MMEVYDFIMETLKKLVLGGGFLILIVFTIYILFAGILWK